MSLSKLSNGDFFPLRIDGQSETWEVIDTTNESNILSLTLRLRPEQNRTTIPAIDEAEYRRTQMNKPYRLILTNIPDGWLHD